ncbi:hypothetical protein [Subdoligranulum variabile]|uniref:Uncharacterized protein n=1 Tax=Subdoligranulum variabile DSM 15176 TaxID=411471 RepID=D1PIQ8_9FIRM|nr:hypothetical protein [Subdoligranulum variabile]EFB77417.1 hypothetical protein SUBVAR_04223 [Subdoligranulum variabile DSM 15176]UWP67306.1 hypothetical protein NQ490_10170 [Subdoligranulum variabile]
MRIITLMENAPGAPTTGFSTFRTAAGRCTGKTARGGLLKIPGDQLQPLHSGMPLDL